jgi:hypothetical protein
LEPHALAPETEKRDDDHVHVEADDLRHHLQAQSSMAR